MNLDWTEFQAFIDKTHFSRILFIFLIAIGSKFLLDLIGFLNSRFIIGERGLFSFLSQRKRKKAITLNQIVFSLLKYIVYFTALGYILRELNVDTNKYLAGLSIIGLALAFGAQGLIQDVVTGFFIIFEGQYDVGDMVEISGQVGIVEEMGLRVTRLRNYLGAAIVIPNRSIGLVGNYSKGYLHAFVDVGVKNTEEGERYIEILKHAGDRLHRQFSGVVADPPKSLGLTHVEKDEVYARIRINIWPAQQWVIEREFVERIRTAFQNRGLEIANNRVAVFYRTEPIEKNTP